MWSGNAYNLTMVEGDYGIQCPIVIEGVTLTASDAFLITIKDKANGEIIIAKDYDNITKNTIPFELTDAESELLSPGFYVFTLDWYQSGSFLCNLIANGSLNVEDKA